MSQIYTFWKKQEVPVTNGSFIELKDLSRGHKMREMVMFWLSTTYSMMADKGTEEPTAYSSLYPEIWCCHILLHESHSYQRIVPNDVALTMETSRTTEMNQKVWEGGRLHVYVCRKSSTDGASSALLPQQGRPVCWLRLRFRNEDEDGNRAKCTKYFLHSCEQMAGPGNNGVFSTKIPQLGRVNHTKPLHQRKKKDEEGIGFEFKSNHQR